MQRQNLAGACLAHFLHDGYTDMLYVLLPVWKPEFGLSYAGLALLRGLYSGTMGGLQLPAGRLTAKMGPGFALALSCLIAAAGYAAMILPFGLPGLCFGLILSGIGSSIQHPRASLLVTDGYGAQARGPLSIYNFSGDLGKSVFPAAVALLLPVIAWRPAVGVMSLAGLAVGIGLLVLLPKRPAVAAAPAGQAAQGQDGRGFGLLLGIGALDTATRMGFLLFLPFLLRLKGGDEAVIGMGLALLFAGGAAGKASCGWLGARLGVVCSVSITEAATAVLIVTSLVLPLGATLAVLPILGMFLNGTSSILYGTVPELARKGDIGRAFALFYTGVLGAGGVAPVLYGVVADHCSRNIAVIAAAMTAAATLPMVIALRPFLRERR